MNRSGALDNPGSAYPGTALPFLFAGKDVAREALNVNQVLSQAAETLTACGIEEARLETEVLLAHVLDWPRARLLAYPDHRLAADQTRRFGRLIALRAARWPLPYLTGWREFFGLRLRVNRAVMIPRPETELLVEAAINRLPTANRQPLTVVDVGTGSGAIAIALAKHLPGVVVTATEASLRALRVAAYNCRLHGLTDRVRLLWGDLLQPLDQPVDLIVANLPYIPTGDLASLPPEVQHEPRLALNGGPDGLDIICRLLNQARDCLKPGGSLLLEIGAEQGPAARALAEVRFPASQVEVLKDYAGLDRILRIGPD
jgi:release factor glutamine methyltransferase